MAGSEDVGDKVNYIYGFNICRHENAAFLFASLKELEKKKSPR